MRKYSKIIIILLVSILSEVVLFNYKFFLTLFNKEIVYTNNELNNVFEIDNINKKVNNIKIEIDTNEYIKVSVYARDDANNNYYLMNTKNISSRNNRSLYQSIHAYGNLKSLKLDSNHINKVIVNSKVPMMFSLVRFFIVFLFVFFVYLFNNKYEIKLFDRKLNKIIIFEVVFLISFFLGFLCIKNDFYERSNLSNQHQYIRLTKAITKGHVYVQEVKDSFLLDMDNPYDAQERDKKAYENDSTYLFDYSFYKGKYYVYFGIGPVLLTYLPFYLLTGKLLTNQFVDLIFMIATIFSSVYLLYSICKKWFKNIKLLTFLICTMLLISSCGVFYVAKRPDFYNVPIIASLFFTTLGLGLFISSTTSKKMFKTKLVIASFCTSFVALCRPQFLISSFLFIPLYYDYFFKKFDKQKLKELLCIIIPYLIVASLTCTYNYIRFGNILDFGATYNLTLNDMTKRGFVLARIPLGIFYYLFVPSRVIPIFPFMEYIPLLSNNYFGKTIYEYTFGGFFFTHLIAIICLFILKFKKYFNDKKLYLFCIFCLVSAFIVIVVDTEMAGILPRYFMDFSYLLLIPTIIIILTMEKKILENKMLKNIFGLLVLFTLTYEFLFLFIDTSPTIRDTMPNTFYYFYYLFTV